MASWLASAVGAACRCFPAQRQLLLMILLLLYGYHALGGLLCSPASAAGSCAPASHAPAALCRRDVPSRERHQQARRHVVLLCNQHAQRLG